MTAPPTPSKRQARRGRIFPEHNWSPEKMAKYKAERAAFGKRCRAVFDRVAPELIADHYNWFIVIEPDSGDYFIDPDANNAVQKACQKYAMNMLGTLRLNETGTCGMI
ncbi:MAG: hypothetical protein MUE44_30565 [Oscillatoriaceae cyanobacterium Prado104]|jgi:hypothetical protein|nr:hypothetical protein [Oscillatoriaceae cyanobacterium Prado104]